MMCKVRNPSRRVGWRSRECGAVGRRAAVRGVYDALDQVVSKDAKWFLGCLVCAAWWALAIVFCRSAYAAPSVEIDGNFAGYENNETYKGYVVVDAPNEYIATLTLIGEYSSLVQIDSDMYAKLSNEYSGGRFYELVQEWQVMGTNASGTAGNYPTWAGSTYFIDGLNTVYGYGHVWECAITDALKAGAKEDFLTILDGGSVGGGGSTVTGEYVLLPVEPWAQSPYNDEEIQEIEYVALEAQDYLDACDYATKNNMKLLAFVYSNGNNYACSVVTYFENKLDPQVYFNLKHYVFYWQEEAHVMYFDNYVKETVTINGKTAYLAGEMAYTVIGRGDDPHWPIQLYGWSEPDGSAESGDSGDEPGDNNWPDDDTPTPPSENPPTPPTINPPSSPTPPTITPYNPTNPSPPTNTTPPTGTTPTDYTPWLQAILQQLINLTSYLETCFSWLGSVLEEHCQHIRDHMTTCSQFIGDYVVGGMSSLLAEHHTFLNGLAQWIVDNLRWENSGGEFDDSNMIYWLRRIYARQGSGEVNSRPVDPATDYSGFAGWLGVLYDAVALDVSDTSLTALTSSLSGLQHTFPFSLPWDVKQVMQALDVSPVTPSASIPSGTSGVSYNVDLHWMDSAMVSVRAFELLVFIVYVMVHTKDLFGYLMGE